MQFQTKNTHLFHDTYTEKRHYKMFKSGKHWVVAGISLLFAGSMMFAAKPDAAHAATDTSSSAANTQTSQTTAASAAAQNSDSNAVLLKSSTAVSASTDSVAASTVSNADSTADKQAATDSASAQTSDAAKSDNAATDTTSQNQSTAVQSDAAADDAKASDTSAASSAADQSTNAASTSAAQTTADSSAATSQSDAAETQSADSSTSSAAADSTSTNAASTDTQVTNLGAATADQLNAAKTTAAATYASTGQAQQVTAASSQSASTATIGTSATKVGYGSGLDTLTITYNITSATAGDVYTVTIPKGNAVLQFQSNYDTLNAAQGTTTLTTNADGTSTITDTFKTDVSGTTTLRIFYNLQTNYNGQPTPIDTVGDTKEEVSIAKNGTVVDTADFTTTVQPSATPGDVTQVQVGAGTGTTVVPDTEYTYSFTVNEANGVFDNNYVSGRVNSAVNYGTTITIPVPTGFTLDEAATMSVNAFSDATTITQANGAGGDITITVPKGSGAQNWQNGASTTGYKLIGTFADTQTASAQTLTASGVATMVQKWDDAGTNTYTVSNATPWSVTLAGSDDTTVKTASSSITLRGNSSAQPTQLVLSDDVSYQYLLTAGFQYQGTATDGASITLTIPDGFNATAVDVPATASSATTYLPDTTSYAYTMMLADGSTEAGTVAAGGTVTSTNGAIRSITFAPNELSGWSTTGNPNTTGALNVTGEDKKTVDGSFFEVVGTLSSTYDNGVAVKIGDSLKASATITVPGTEDATQSITQTITSPVSVTTAYVDQQNENAGETGGVFALLGSAIVQDMTTTKIYEPILYYVLPSVVTVKSITGTQKANVSQTVLSDGRLLITIDYTGTGESVDMSTGTYDNNAVWVTNNADALSGDYPYDLYIYSPTTQLAQTTVVKDTTLTGGHADAVKMKLTKGDWNWTILQATTTSQFTQAQGDDAAPVQNATADKNSTAQLSFDANIVNTAGDAGSAALVVNLPETGDKRGSQYTFDLTGPVTLPDTFTTTSGKTVALSGTVLYSTSRNALAASSTAADLTGYVTADQITDWSTVRSILIKLDSLPAQVSTGRIVFNGTVEDMVDQGQTTGKLETGLYLGSAKVAVDSAADAATLEITGSSTIKARAHYIDDDGNDQYIYFTDLDQTLLDNTDKVPEPTTLVLSADDTKQIPKGYSLVSAPPIYVDSQGHAVSITGQTITNDDDGDYAQFELVADEVTLKFEYVDEDTGTVVPIDPSKASVSGAPGDEITYNVTLPTGYELGKNQSATLTYTLTSQSNKDTMVVHLSRIVDHGTATTTRTINYVYADGTTAAPSVTQTVNWNTTTDAVSGETVYTAQVAYYEQTSPTIAGYTASQATVAQVAVGPTTTEPTNAANVTVTYTADTQNATVNFETTDGTSLGNVAISGPSGSDVPASSYQTELAALEAKNYTVQTNGATGAKFDSDDTTPQTFTIVMTAPVTIDVTYVDDADNGKAVTVPDTTASSITGAQDSTGTYTAVVPSNYELAKGQDATVAYTLSSGADGITIHLTHAVAHTTTTTTRTINYAIADGGTTAPAAQTQTLTWNVSTDQVTGVTVATPVGDYAAVVSPTVAGYTPDQATVGDVQPAATTAAPVNADAVTVTYTADTQSATINFVTTDGKSLGSTTVSGPSGSTIAANSYEAALTALEDQGYTVQSDGAVGAKFDDDSTQNQSFTVVLLAPTSTDNGGGSTTGDDGGSTTGNNGGSTTGNDGGTTTGDNGGSTTGNNGGSTTGTLPDTDGGGTTTGDNGGTATDNNGSSDTTGDDGAQPHGLPDTYGDGTTSGSLAGSTATATQTGTATASNASQQLPATGGTGNAASAIQQAAAKQNVLPQTGDDNGNALAVIGVGLAGLLSMFGLARKRKHEDD
jgi:LPXTG-motif cell wall-anchored protein